mmetsp:Transcript_8700/g.15667  ORF Transcript_8700/g.15667 Transcript_8700/m.15667 type:complete len:428 (+) Transcript_8700:1088-2371(+)
MRLNRVAASAPKGLAASSRWSKVSPRRACTSTTSQPVGVPGGKVSIIIVAIPKCEKAMACHSTECPEASFKRPSHVPRWTKAVIAARSPTCTACHSSGGGAAAAVACAGGAWNGCCVWNVAVLAAGAREAADGDAGGVRLSSSCGDGVSFSGLGMLSNVTMLSGSVGLEPGWCCAKLPIGGTCTPSVRTASFTQSWKYSLLSCSLYCAACSLEVASPPLLAMLALRLRALSISCSHMGRAACRYSSTPSSTAASELLDCLSCTSHFHSWLHASSRRDMSKIMDGPQPVASACCRADIRDFCIEFDAAKNAFACSISVAGHLACSKAAFTFGSPCIPSLASKVLLCSTHLAMPAALEIWVSASRRAATSWPCSRSTSREDGSPCPVGIMWKVSSRERSSWLSADMLRLSTYTRKLSVVPSDIVGSAQQ